MCEREREIEREEVEVFDFHMRAKFVHAGAWRVCMRTLYSRAN